MTESNGMLCRDGIFTCLRTPLLWSLASVAKGASAIFPIREEDASFSTFSIFPGPCFNVDVPFTFARSGVISVRFQFSCRVCPSTYSVLKLFRDILADVCNDVCGALNGPDVCASKDKVPFGW